MALPPGTTPPVPAGSSAPPKGGKGKPPPPKKKPAPGVPPNPYQSQAQSEIDPIIAAITTAAQNQAGAADQAIQGLTDSYAKGISGIDYGAPYSGAEAQQAAVDAALQQAASGQGADLAASLTQRLQALQGSSGAPAVEQAAQALASQGQGAGAAQLASGSAALGQLIGDAAAARGYGAKMPGVIRSAGLQGIEQSQGQAQQAINQGTLSAEGQLPQIEQSLKADHLQAQATKSEAAYRNAEIAAKDAMLGIDSAKARASIAQGNARIQQGDMRLQQGSARLQIEAQRAAQTALNSNRSYSLSLSRLGIEGQHLQLEALTAQTKLANGGFTPAELVKLRGQASQVIANGKQSGYTRGQVLNNLTANGIPIGLVGSQLKAGGYAKVPSIPTPKIRHDANGLVSNPAGGTFPFGARHGGEGLAGKGAASFTSNAGGFLPKGMGFEYDRQDQGRDIQTRVGAPILAPGDGYVVRIASDPGGGGAHFGPSYPVVHFTSGPYAGKDVYIGHTVAAVRPGQRFRLGTVLSHTQQSGPMNGGAPSGWAEIGFAPGGSPGPFDQTAPF